MDKLSLSLECPICYQTLVDPRILPCAHTFCINCIISMCHGVDDTRCPVCRAIAIVPINGGKGFPTNYLVANLLEQIQAATNAKINSRLCSGVHAAMEVALYCVTCSEMICHKCAYDNHPKRRHKCISIEEASKNIRSQLLKSDNTSEREEVVTAKTQLYEQQADVELHLLSITDEIKQFYDGITTYLQRRKNAMLRAVDNCNSIQQHAINKKQLEEAQDTIQEFEDRDEMITSLLRLEDVELLTRMKNQQGFHNIAIPVLSVPTNLVRFTTMDNARAYIDKICSLQSDRNGSLEEMEIDEGSRVVEMKDLFESNTSINIIIQNNYNNDNNDGNNDTRKISTLGSEIEYELDELDQLEHELEQELATQNNSIISNNQNNINNDNEHEENENDENDEIDENENEEYTNDNENENENESEQGGLQNNDDYSENDNIEHENYRDMFSYNNNNEQIESDDESYRTARLTPSLLPSSNDTDYDIDYSSPLYTRSFSPVSRSRSPSLVSSSSSSSSSRNDGDYGRSSAVLRRLPSYSSTTSTTSAHYPSYSFNSSHSSSSSNSNTLREKSNYWLSKIWRQ